MLRRAFILILIVFHASLLRAQNAGISEAGITVDGTIYSEPGNSIHNSTIFKSKGQKLNLTSIYLKTFQNVNTGRICKGYFFYRIFPENTAAPAFSQIDCGLSSVINGSGSSNILNQVWQNNNININLLRDLDTGRYTIEIYYGIDAPAVPADCSNTPNIILKKGAEFFKATLVINVPLNIVYTGFITRTNNEKVFLEWGIQQAVSELQYFILEKSKNGVAWSVMDTIHVSGVQYNYLDATPYAGINFYRVRASGGIGKVNYSIVRRIYVGYVENIVTIYPNPVYKNLRFQMTAILKGQYDAVVYTMDGARITARNINHDGNDNYVTIPLPSTLRKGIYWLVLYSKSEFYKRSFLVE